MFPENGLIRALFIPDPSRKAHWAKENFANYKGNICVITGGEKEESAYNFIPEAPFPKTHDFRQEREFVKFRIKASRKEYKTILKRIEYFQKGAVIIDDATFFEQEKELTEALDSRVCFKRTAQINFYLLFSHPNRASKYLKFFYGPTS